MDGFERRKAQSRSEIRQAACELFGQFGVDRVTIADIARKAGVSPATIYNHFCSKEKLAREFVKTAINELVVQVQEVLALDVGFGAKMRAFFQFIADRVADRGQPHSALDRTLFATSSGLWEVPEMVEIRAAAREKMSDLLLSIVQQGRAEGVVNPDLSERSLRIYFGAFMDLFVAPRVQQQLSTEPELVWELCELMLSGLGARPPQQG